MTRFPTLDIRHPRPFDLVPNAITVVGIGAAFEANIGRVDVLDSANTVLASAPLHAESGGMGYSSFTATLHLNAIPTAPHGLLVAMSEPMIDPAVTLSIPVVFGAALVSPYGGFSVHTVAAGDTLWAIADAFYGDGALWPRLYEANRDILTNPDLIYPGQELRVPVAI